MYHCPELFGANLGVNRPQLNVHTVHLPYQFCMGSPQNVHGAAGTIATPITEKSHVHFLSFEVIHFLS